MDVVNMDQAEVERITGEQNHTTRVMADADGHQLRDHLNAERAQCWATAFGEISLAQGAEVVQWEEILEKKGFVMARNSPLGSGEFSEVYKGRSLATAENLACKVVRKKEVANAYKIKDMERHFKLLAKLSHPKIVRVVAMFEAKNTHKFYLFTQMADLGSVYKYIEKHRKPVSGDVAKRWARDCAQALSFLHFLGIAHRRVHPKHLMLRSLEDVAKLSVPMGFAEICDPEKNDNAVIKCRSVGTPNSFSAPESVFGHSFDALAADVWSYGSLVYYLLVKKSPFEKWGDKKKLKEQLDSKRWAFCGIVDKSPKLADDSKAFLETIIHGSVDKRPTMSQILALPWLN